MLELLGAAFVNHGRHRCERAVPRLRQPAQIASRHRRAVAGFAAEKAAKAVDEDGKCLGHPIDQGSVGFIDPDIRLRDELAGSFRLPTRSNRWRPINSIKWDRVKPRCEVRPSENVILSN